MGKNLVLGFIDKQRSGGASDKEILRKLLNAGWPADIILRSLEYKPFENVETLKKPVVERSKVYHLAGSFRSFL